VASNIDISLHVAIPHPFIEFKTYTKYDLFIKWHFI